MAQKSTYKKAVEEMSAFLYGVKVSNRWDDDTLAEKLKMVRTTLYKRKKNPLTWRIGELKRLSIITQTPLSEIYSKLEV